MSHLQVYGIRLILTDNENAATEFNGQNHSARTPELLVSAFSFTITRTFAGVKGNGTRLEFVPQISTQVAMAILPCVWLTQGLPLSGNYLGKLPLHLWLQIPLDKGGLPVPTLVGWSGTDSAA